MGHGFSDSKGSQKTKKQPEPIEQPQPKVQPIDPVQQQQARQQINDFLTSDRSEVLFVSESNKRHFFMIIPSEYSLSFRRSRFAFTQDEYIKEQAQVAKEILTTSPDTKLTIFCSRRERASATVMAFIAAAPELDKFFPQRWEVIYGKDSQDMWAQDYGESTRRMDGSSEFIMPVVPGLGHRSLPHLTRIPVTKIPILFEGGDLATTQVGEKKLVVVGPHTLAHTRSYYYNKGGYKISDEEIRKILKKAFSADTVLFLTPPNKGDFPILAFHIDQAVFFPKDGVAIMVKPESIPANADNSSVTYLRETLLEYRRQLKDAGFTVVEIPTTPEHLEQFQSYTNAVPIKEEDGSTVLIIPSFGDTAIESEIRHIIEEQGMGVRFVPNSTFVLHGNTHCVTGNLARVDEALPQELEGTSNLIPTKVA